MNKVIRRLVAAFVFAGTPFMAAAQKRPIPETVLKLDGGVSFITSKVYVYNFSDKAIHEYRCGSRGLLRPFGSKRAELER